MADGLGDFVGAAIEFFAFGQFCFAVVFEFQKPIDIDLHAAVGTVLFDSFGVGDNEFAIEHDGCLGFSFFELESGVDGDRDLGQF
jgi:hypothetical protein